MLRVVLNAWVTKTPAAEILANPATRRRQVTMTISLNPLRSATTSVFDITYEFFSLGAKFSPLSRGLWRMHFSLTP